MFKQKLKQRFFSLVVKLPIATITVIAITLVCLILIECSSYTNIYTKRSAEINYKKESNDTLIKLYIKKEDIGQQTINSDVLWYLEQEGKWYKAPIIETKDIPENNTLLLSIKPSQNEVKKEFINKPNGVYPINVEILTKRVKIIEKLFYCKSEAN